MKAKGRTCTPPVWDQGHHLTRQHICGHQGTEDRLGLEHHDYRRHVLNQRSFPQIIWFSTSTIHPKKLWSTNFFQFSSYQETNAVVEQISAQ